MSKEQILLKYRYRSAEKIENYFGSDFILHEHLYKTESTFPVQALIAVSALLDIYEVLSSSGLLHD
jgi:hypothetical protein